MPKLKIEKEIINGNIPINKKLLNKYKNFEDIFSNIKEEKYLKIKKRKIPNVKDLSNTDLYKFACKIFKNYHNINYFENNKNIIHISNKDIKESINKIFYNPNQKELINEHILIFSYLGKIIKTSTLISQSLENKNREHNNLWNYYINWLKIENDYYLLEFDVVSRNNGENHYRLQRLIKSKYFS